ncbi:hypothetical protein GT50_00925 [Geobacillus stearothermophilus 10]|nr:hypothetical protein GT50_00925 [Geobacillus stearothermophilus 10]
MTKEDEVRRTRAILQTRERERGVSQKDRDTLFRLYIYALTASFALYFVSILKADSLLGQPHESEPFSYME